MAAARRRQLFLPWPVAGEAANAAGARPVPAQGRHGSRHAARKSGTVTIIEGDARPCRDDLQQPRPRRLRALPLRAALTRGLIRSASAIGVRRTNAYKPAQSRTW